MDFISINFLKYLIYFHIKFEKYCPKISTDFHLPPCLLQEKNLLILGVYMKMKKNKKNNSVQLSIHLIAFLLLRQNKKELAFKLTLIEENQCYAKHLYQ